MNQSYKGEYFGAALQGGGDRNIRFHRTTDTLSSVRFMLENSEKLFTQKQRYLLKKDLDPTIDEIHKKRICKNCKRSYTINSSYGKFECRCHYGYHDTYRAGPLVWSCCNKPVVDNYYDYGCTQCEHIDENQAGYGSSTVLPHASLPLSILFGYKELVSFVEKHKDSLLCFTNTNTMNYNNNNHGRINDIDDDYDDNKSNLSMRFNHSNDRKTITFLKNYQESTISHDEKVHDIDTKIKIDLAFLYDSEYRSYHIMTNPSESFKYVKTNFSTDRGTSGHAHINLVESKLILPLYYSRII